MGTLPFYHGQHIILETKNKHYAYTNETDLREGVHGGGGVCRYVGNGAHGRVGF